MKTEKNSGRSKKRTVKQQPQPLCRVPLRSFFVYDGVKYMKYASKRGITESGKTVMLTDATLVMVVS